MNNRAIRIEFEKTPEQIQLIKQAGSKKVNEALEAQEYLAARVLTPVVREVLDNIGSAALIYKDITYSEGDSPRFPLDLYYDQSDDFITVFEQGGNNSLASSHVQSAGDLRFTTYMLGAAVDIDKNYARFGNLDVVAKAINKLSQEILLKQENHAWNVIMKILANASTGGADHLITTGTQDTLTIDDFNNLWELSDEINQSFSGGTTLGSYYGPTDIFLSHTAMTKLRAMAYNPINTQGANQTAGTNASGVIGMPEEDRRKFFQTGQAPEFMGFSFHKLLELKDNGKYSQLFDTYIGSNTVAHGASQFATDDQIIVALDLSRDAFLRPVAIDSEVDSTVVVNVDDQYRGREDKMGWYTNIQEGRVCIDGRVVSGLIM